MRHIKPRINQQKLLVSTITIVETFSAGPATIPPKQHDDHRFTFIWKSPVDSFDPEYWPIQDGVVNVTTVRMNLKRWEKPRFCLATAYVVGYKITLRTDNEEMVAFRLENDEGLLVPDISKLNYSVFK